MTYRAYLDAPLPIAFAHRGGADEAPENTLPAFEAAVALGYRYLETDTHLSADGALVAFHDAALDRVTDGSGRIADLTLDQVRQADAGYWFTGDGGRTFPFRGKGITVPTLEEILTRWPSTRVNIDPKVRACVEPLVKLLQRLDAFDRVCIGAFSDRTVARFRALTRGRVCTSTGQSATAIAWLASRARGLPSTRADCVQVPRTWRGITVVDSVFIKAAHRAGMQVHVWTVDDAASMTELLDLGVDGIMSDRPRLLRSVLVERGEWTGSVSPDAANSD